MTGQKNRFSTTEKLWNLDDKQLKSPEHDAMECWLMEEDNVRQLLKPLIKFQEKEGFLSKQYNKNDIINNTVTIDSEVPISSSPTFVGGYADHIVTWKLSKSIENYPCPIDHLWGDLVDKTKNLEDMNLLLQRYLNDKNYDMKQCCKEECYYYSNGSKDFKYYENGKEISYPDYSYLNSEHTMERKKSSISWSSSNNNANEDQIIRRKFIDFMGNIGEDYPCSELDIQEWIKGDRFYHKYNSTSLTVLIEVKPYIDSFGAVLRQIKTYIKFIEDTYEYRSSRRVNNFNIDEYCIFTLDDRFDRQFESQGIKVLHPPKDITIDDMRDMYGLW